MMQHQKTVIFLHIPKAAGTTLTQILRRQYSEQQILCLTLPNNTKALPHSEKLQIKLDKLRQLSDSEKRQIKLLHGHFPFGAHELLPQSATYITMLRDPVKRVISTYFYAKRTPGHRHYEKINQEGISLKDYISSKINPQLNNGQVRMLSGKSDVDFGNCNEKMLEKAKSNLNNYFSVVGTLESFDKTVLSIKEVLGYNNVFYSKTNVSKSKNDQQIDSNLIEMIKSENELDLELYNYVLKLQEEMFSRLMIDQKLKAFKQMNNLYSLYRSLINNFKYGVKISRNTLSKIQLMQ